MKKNRNADNATAQQYLKRVKYGNTVMYSSPMNAPIAAIPATNEWMFELIFDYGEHETVNKVPQYADNLTWAARPDPFSSYRAGFEIRDYRLCRRILMFHRFSELGTDPYLVKATLLEYNENEIATQVNSITHAGYLTEKQRDHDQNLSIGQFQIHRAKNRQHHIQCRCERACPTPQKALTANVT
ncbi:MAG: hypothetical protein IPL27_05990 [Lewinellaceae bacterium]|nr:hypothetical protein [Lewinellaceae bacterium]